MEDALREFFELINQDFLFYSITIHPDGKTDMKWEGLTPQDYTTPPGGANRIILRIHKTNSTQRHYFLDVFQYFQHTEWKGFPMSRFSRYEIILTEGGWFDAVFSFETGETITFRHINTQVFLILQDFFTGFMLR